MLFDYDSYEMTALRKILRSDGGRLDYNSKYPTVLKHVNRIIDDTFENMTLDEAMQVKCLTYDEDGFWYKILVRLGFTNIFVRIDTGSYRLINKTEAESTRKEYDMVDRSFYDCALNWSKYIRTPCKHEPQFLYKWMAKNITHQITIPDYGERGQGVHLANN
jgi:hypothetical protein